MVADAITDMVITMSAIIVTAVDCRRLQSQIQGLQLQTGRPVNWSIKTIELAAAQAENQRCCLKYDLSSRSKVWIAGNLNSINTFLLEL